MQCPPDQDHKYIAKARQIADILDDSPSTKVFHIQTCQSLYLDMFYSHHTVPITIDSGAKGNMIRHTLVQHLGCHMTSSSQSVHQADGSSPLHAVDETCSSSNREGREFTFEGLIIRNLDVYVLAGTPFNEANDIAVRPAKRQVILGDSSIYSYGSQHPAAVGTAACRTLVFRSPPTPITIWPGEFIEVELPSDAPPDSEYALEPRIDVPSLRKLTVARPGHSLQHGGKDTYSQSLADAALPKAE